MPVTVTYNYLKLISGDRLITMDASKIILSYLFPAPVVFHTIQLLLPKSGHAIRIRITDLNR
jgi:hypothetical protein